MWRRSKQTGEWRGSPLLSGVSTRYGVFDTDTSRVRLAARELNYGGATDTLNIYRTFG